MSEENTQEAVEAQPIPLIERLERCKSRKSARETIADFCDENGYDPKKFKLSSEELFLFAALK